MPFTPEQLARIKARQAEYTAQLQPQIDALRASSRITAADLAITINSPEPTYRAPAAEPRAQGDSQ